MSAIQRQDRPDGDGLSGASTRRGRLAAGLLLLALSLGAAQVRGAARAADAPTAAPAVPSAPASQAELAAQVVELTEHIHGMEGKLKESAAARKTADQARMEAERRLAEGTQENGRLSAEIGLLREAKAALEARLTHAEEQNTRGAERLGAQEERVRRLTAEGEAQTRRTEGLEHQIELLKEAQRLADEAHEVVLRDVQTAQAELSTKLSERDAALDRLNADLIAAKGDQAILEAQLQSAGTQQPAPEGGVLALQEAQARSAAAAAALREAQAPARGNRDGKANQAVQEAEQVLQQRQFDAARITGARSLYRVRPADTLARIGSRFYGNSTQWQAIYEANRNVLSDPDRLTPGMTLVIP